MELHRQLFYAYTTLYRPYLNRLNMELSEFKLASSQWAIMNFLLRNGAHTISDISTYRNVERPTVTKMVQRLIELDYVESRVGEDKRIRLIQLTPFGHQICEQILEKLGRLQKFLLADIEEEDQQRTIHALRSIAEKINEYKE